MPKSIDGYEEIIEETAFKADLTTYEVKAAVDRWRKDHPELQASMKNANKQLQIRIVVVGVIGVIASIIVSLLAIAYFSGFAE